MQGTSNKQQSQQTSSLPQLLTSLSGGDPWKDAQIDSVSASISDCSLGIVSSEACFDKHPTDSRFVQLSTKLSCKTTSRTTTTNNNGNTNNNNQQQQLRLKEQNNNNDTLSYDKIDILAKVQQE